jgi:uncharacterized protein (TIGR02145 family)
MNTMFAYTALSEENQCLIHTSFSSNENWPYEWSGFCPPAPCGDLVSHEGYDYSTVQIGDQCWFSENCRYLPEVSDSPVGSQIEPLYYVFDYLGTDVEAAKSTADYENYGVLYNWPAVMTEGICPNGWHIPSDEEFTQLTDFLGGEAVAGYAMKDDMQWDGSNVSGFNGLPGGVRYPTYFGASNYGVWWSSSLYDNGLSSWYRDVVTQEDRIVRTTNDPAAGFSARCIQD